MDRRVTIRRPVPRPLAERVTAAAVALARGEYSSLYGYELLALSEDLHTIEAIVEALDAALGLAAVVSLLLADAEDPESFLARACDAISDPDLAGPARD